MEKILNNERLSQRILTLYDTYNKKKAKQTNTKFYIEKRLEIFLNKLRKLF